MGKQLRVWGLALLMVGLVALPAFAGLTTVNFGGVLNTAITTSLEVMGVARTVTITAGGGNDGIVFTPGQQVAVGNLIEVTFSGATFIGAAGPTGGTTYNICNAGATIATATPGATAGPFNFQVNVLSAVGAALNLTNQACAALDQAVDVSLSATATAITTATVRFRLLTAAAILVDDSTAKTLATIRSEDTAAVNNSNHIIDVVTAGANGTLFTAATSSSAGTRADPTVAGPVNSVVLSRTGNDVQVRDIPVAGVDATDPITTATVTVTTTDFTGVTSVFLVNTATGNCTTGVSLVASAVNPAVLVVPQATFSTNTPAPAVGTTTPVNLIVCITVNGTTFLNPRTFTAAVSIALTGPAGLQNPAGVGATTVQTWNINGADFRLTGVKGGPTGNTTVISINNLGPNNATLRRLEVYRLDSTGALGAPSCVVTNVSGATKTFFARSGQTLNAETDVTTLCSAQAPFITGASAEAYGLRIILDMAPGDVGVQATRVFPDGRLLSIPVLKGAPGGAVFAAE
jgi:hypothetical protein